MVLLINSATKETHTVQIKLWVKERISHTKAIIM